MLMVLYRTSGLKLIIAEMKIAVISDIHGHLLCVFRLPVYAAEVLWQTLCYLVQKVADKPTLRFVPVLYHNLSYLPHPFLAKHIILNAEKYPVLVGEVLSACDIAPGQRHAGKAVLDILKDRKELYNADYKD